VHALTSKAWKQSFKLSPCLDIAALILSRLVKVSSLLKRDHCSVSSLMTIKLLSPKDIHKREDVSRRGEIYLFRAIRLAAVGVLSARDTLLALKLSIKVRRNLTTRDTRCAQSSLLARMSFTASRVHDTTSATWVRGPTRDSGSVGMSASMVGRASAASQRRPLVSPCM
jgi:hypothetical protein